MDLIGHPAVVSELATQLGLTVQRKARLRPDLRAEVHATGVVDAVAVELLADVQNRQADGQWSAPQGIGRPVLRRFQERVVPVVGLPRLLRLADLRGDASRVQVIRSLLQAASPLSQCPAVLFDLDGTLLDHDTAAARAAQALAARLGHSDPAGLVPVWFALEGRYMPAYLDGQLSFQQQRRARLRDFAVHVGAPLHESRLDEVFAGYLADYEHGWAAYPDAVPALQQLKHLRRGVLSNGDRNQQRHKLAAAGLLGLVDVLITSDELGFAKPHPEAFQAAARRLNTPPARTVCVGDRYDTDARAAQQAGLRGVWLSRGGPAEAPAELVTPTVRDLRDLPALLAG